MSESLLKNRNFVFLSACAILAALSFNFILGAFFRPLWFDEAITVMDFVLQPNPVDIYRFYNIPNNHIVYNFFLRLWIDICGPIPYLDRVSLRLFTVLTTIAAIILIMRFWGRRFSRETAIIACFCLVLSPAFAIYSTAVRGYMLSLLLIIIALEFSLRYMETGKNSHLAILFAMSFLTAGIMPTNLIASAAIFILLLPSFRRKDIPGRKTILLAAVPVAAFIIFYLPISGKLIRALSLSEGWSDGIGASIHFYGAFAISFLPLIVLAAVSRFTAERKSPVPSIVTVTLIFLIPLFVFMAKSPAPFPRAFICLWPIWLFILCRAADPLVRRINGRYSGLALAGLLMICLAWAAGPFKLSTQLSEILSKGGQDDFFKPYFMRADFRPTETVSKCTELAGAGASNRVFIDFAADYPSIIFYSRILRIDDKFWVFDRPGKKIDSLDGIGNIFAVTRSDGEMDAIAKRFNVKSYELVTDCGYQKIYRAKLK